MATSTELVATILAQMETLAQVHAQRPHRAERLQEARSASFKQRIDALGGALTDKDAVMLSDAAELALGPHAQIVLDAIDHAIAYAPPRRNLSGDLGEVPNPSELPRIPDGWPMGTLDTSRQHCHLDASGERMRATSRMRAAFGENDEGDAVDGRVVDDCERPRVSHRPAAARARK